MPRFFLPDGNIIDGRVIITGSDARHIALSLRMRVGERLTVCDFSRREYECALETITPDRVIAAVLSCAQSSAEPPCMIKLYQALPKGDKLDEIIKKSVETGAGEIIPFISERCVSRPDPASGAKKLERLRRIALEAAKQCGRAAVPEVSEIVSFGEAVKEASKGGLKFICYEGEGTVPLGILLRETADVPKDIRFVVGAEGGFTLAEFETAKAAGLAAAGLGKRILRCETAPVFVTAALITKFELGG